MDQRQEVLDLSIVFTQPPLDSSPETLAHVSVRCDALGLSHTGEAFTDPLTQHEWDDLHWYLEEYWLWPYLEFAERGKRVEALLGEIGRRFYHRLFGSHEAHNIVQIWQQHMHVQHQISIVSEIASILHLPWELLADSQGFLVLRADHPTTLVRRLPTKSEHVFFTSPFQVPLRILLVTARPEDAGFVDPRSISRALVDELQRQSEAGTIELEFLRPPTFSALRARLQDTKRPIHVLHFDGHGGLDQKAQQGILLFETNAGKQSPIRASDIAKVLSASGVRIAILTACQSAMNTEDNAFSSVSTQLINNGMDAVIAMSSSILVTSAALYAEAFYRALTRGLPVSIAQEQARQALHKDPHRHLFSRRPDEEAAPVTLADWWIPHFYQQRSLTLHATIAPRKRSQQQASVPARFNDAMPPEPRYHFNGRARELLQIERHFLHKRPVVLSGFGGVGKTALAREAADWLTRTSLYTSACFVSFEHGGDVSMLLSILGTFLGVQDGHYNPGNPDAALAHLKPVLQARPTLVIADNLETLLPGGEAPLELAARSELWHVLRELARLEVGVLLTSRAPLAGEDLLALGAPVAVLPLSGLLLTDAYALATRLLKNLGIDRARAPYAELRDLLAQLDHHPLAIQLVLPTLRERSLDTIRTDFATLLLTFKDDTATGRNRSLLASLDYSLSRLTTEQRYLLSRLAPFEGGASENNLLTITGIPEATWLPLRTALEHVALLTVEHIHDDVTVSFLQFHPILTPYLRSLPHPPDEVLHQRYALRYHLVADYLFQEHLHYPPAVHALFQLELPNLRRALAFLLEAGELDTASDTANRIARLLSLFGLARERDEMRKRVDEAVRLYTETTHEGPSEQPLTQAEYLRESSLGEDEYEQGHLRAAAARFLQLLTHIEAQPAGDELGKGSYTHSMTLHRLARCFEAAGQPAKAERLLRQALVIIVALLTKNPKDRWFIQQHSALLADLGDVLSGQGQYTQALEAYEESLRMARRQGNTRGEAVALGQLGTLALKQRAYKTAQDRYQEALVAVRQFGEPALEAISWHQLGRVAQEQKQWVRAEQCYRESLVLKESIGDVVGAADTCNQLAIVTEHSERSIEAEGWYLRALVLYEKEQSNSPPHARALNNLAYLLVNSVQSGRAPSERLNDAKRYVQQALEIRKHLVSAEIWNSWHVLAIIAELEGQIDAARQYRRSERETFAEFEGNRYHIDQQFGDLIAVITAVTRGNKKAKKAVEERLPKLEENGLKIADAIRRIWKGERDWHALVEGIDRDSALLVLRVLETVEGEKSSG